MPKTNQVKIAREESREEVTNRFIQQGFMVGLKDKQAGIKSLKDRVEQRLQAQSKEIEAAKKATKLVVSMRPTGTEGK